jgi:hypothetical protein
MGFRAASWCYTGGSLPVTQKAVFMETSGITATLPAQDLGRARAFYAERVGLQAAEADFLEATDGRVGLRFEMVSTSSLSIPLGRGRRGSSCKPSPPSEDG